MKYIYEINNKLYKYIIKNYYNGGTNE